MFQEAGDTTKPSPCTTKPFCNYVIPCLDWQIPKATLFSDLMKLFCNLDFRWRQRSVKGKNTGSLCDCVLCRTLWEQNMTDTRSYILQWGTLKECKCCSDGVKTNAWDSWGLGLIMYGWNSSPATRRRIVGISLNIHKTKSKALIHKVISSFSFPQGTADPIKTC